jgi:hypothetical protein
VFIEVDLLDVLKAWKQTTHFGAACKAPLKGRPLVPLSEQQTYFLRLVQSCGAEYWPHTIHLAGEETRRLVILLLLLSSYAFGRGGGHASGHSSGHSTHSHSSRASKAKASKTVHVKEYTRKDGTVVHAHDRAAPGTASAGVTGVGTVSHASYRKNHVATGYALHPSVERDRHGKIKRNSAARADFMRQHPCPATGKTSGRCPGYIVDHVNALECGGADAPVNMQWQTTAAAKAKDRTERYCR